MGREENKGGGSYIVLIVFLNKAYFTYLRVTCDFSILQICRHVHCLKEDCSSPSLLCRLDYKNGKVTASVK